MSRLRTLLLSGVAALPLCASPALAEGDDVSKRLDQMQAMIEAQQKQITAQQDEIAQLRAALKKPKEPRKAKPEPVAGVESRASMQPAALLLPVAAATPAEAPAKTAAASDQPIWTFANMRPMVSSADGRNTLALRARIQADAAHYYQDVEGPLATDFRRGSVGSATNRENTAARDLNDGANFRRAQLGIEGKIEEDFGYRIVYEFGGSGVEGPGRIKDAMIAYTGLAPFTFAAGAYSTPTNLDDNTSDDGALFIERASSAEISRAFAGADGRYSAGFKANEDWWYAALNWSGGVAGEAEVFDEQEGVVARLAARPFFDKEYNVHLGANIAYVYEPADQGLGTIPQTPLRFRDRPEMRVDSTRLIDTGPIDSDSGYAAGVEFAANWQNVGVQAEYFGYGFERPDSAGLADPSFDGFYAQAWWVFTGEERKYSMATASYSGPKPALSVTEPGGIGAWEFGVRYSNVDLNYHEGVAGLVPPPEGVRGGEQNNWTLALNWYPTTTLKFAINYIVVDVDRLNPASVANPAPFGAAPATPPIGVQVGQELDILAARLQFSM